MKNIHGQQKTEIGTNARRQRNQEQKVKREGRKKEKKRKSSKKIRGSNFSGEEFFRVNYEQHLLLLEHLSSKASITFVKILNFFPQKINKFQIVKK
jgi:hypothetical protein